MTDSDDRGQLFEWKTCYGCGQANEHGLRLEPPGELNAAGEMVVRAVMPEHFAGFPGMLHGGVIATMLDEVIGYHSIRAFSTAPITAELNVRYRAPVPTNTPVEIVATGTRDGRRIDSTARIVAGDGTVLAEATARMVAQD